MTKPSENTTSTFSKLKLTGGWRKEWGDDIRKLGYEVYRKGGKSFTIHNGKVALDINPVKGDTMETAVQRALAEKEEAIKRAEERRKKYPAHQTLTPPSNGMNFRTGRRFPIFTGILLASMVCSR